MRPHIERPSKSRAPGPRTPDGRPAKAGIDPANKPIGRMPDGNVVPVEVAGR